MAITPSIWALVRGIQALDNVSPSLSSRIALFRGNQSSDKSLKNREPETVLGPLNLEADTLAELRLTIGRRLTPKPIKVRADIEVKCFAYQGIQAIKKALTAGEACSTEAVQIKIRLVAPPEFVMTTTSTDKAAAISVMEKAVEKIGEVITEEKGDMTVKMAVSQTPRTYQWTKADDIAKGRFRDG